MSVFSKAFWQTLWEDKKLLVWAIIGVLSLTLVVYLYFQFKRSWNYSFGYESRVQATICEMVEPQHLTSIGRDICD